MKTHLCGLIVCAEIGLMVSFLNGCGKIDRGDKPLATLAPSATSAESRGKDSDAQPALVQKLIHATVSVLTTESSSTDVIREAHSVTGTSIDTLQTQSSEVIKLTASSQNVSSATQSSSLTAALQFLTPRPFLLNASNLEKVLRPVFGSFGQMSTANPRYFIPDDKFRLGEYAMVAIPDEVKVRMGPNISVSQDYLFALRTFAGLACTNLVNSEKNNPSNTSNVLVNSTDWNANKIQPETISKFMTQLFGYAPQSGALHAGASEYADTFNAAVANPAPRTIVNAKLDNYKLVCVYVVSDPRTFSR